MSDVTVDDIAARALASMILTHTADAIADGGERAAEALQVFANDSGLLLEVAAAVLQACLTIAVMGDVQAEAIFGAALATEPDEEETGPVPEPEPEPEPGGPVEIVTDVPAFSMLSLTEDQQGSECDFCTCAALGSMVQGLVCFHHMDHTPADGLCPFCGQSKASQEDQETTTESEG